jgi:UDPglucose 6-dehydrogenase
MKVCIYGLWHLGSVTAACLASSGFSTVGLEDDPAAVKLLASGTPPLFEPGLEELFRAGLDAGTLSFTSDPRAVSDCDVVWITFDTPVDDDDRADVGYVVERICSLFPYLRDNSVLLVSAQLPVGTMAEVEKRFVGNGRRVSFAVSPENLRLGKAIQVFRHPERVIIGVRGDAAKPVLTELFAPFSDNIIWTGIEAAELSKHAINAFLATSVTFINEIAVLCEKMGADAREVERALRSEPRIGPNAYIRPGAAFAGGTLARDVTFLSEIAARNGLPLNMIGSILESNRFHRGWPFRKLQEVLGNLQGRKICVLGLAYKPGTSATRRSAAIELGDQLSAAGAIVSAFDPSARELPRPIANMSIAASAGAAFEQADALVLMTEWPEFRKLQADELAAHMAKPNVLDQSGFLGYLADDKRIKYLTTGRPQ